MFNKPELGLLNIYVKLKEHKFLIKIIHKIGQKGKNVKRFCGKSQLLISLIVDKFEMDNSLGSFEEYLKRMSGWHSKNILEISCCQSTCW
jgi:hypothetical protein